MADTSVCSRGGGPRVRPSDHAQAPGTAFPTALGQREVHRVLHELQRGEVSGSTASSPDPPFRALVSVPAPDTEPER